LNLRNDVSSKKERRKNTSLSKLCQRDNVPGYPLKQRSKGHTNTAQRSLIAFTPPSQKINKGKFFKRM